MTLTTLILLLAIGLLVLIMILFPEARVLFKGLLRIFIKDMATTPEGAQAIYAEKIEQAQDAYNKADNALRVAAGKLNRGRRKTADLKNRLTKVEAECETLVRAGQMDMALLKSEEREDILSDLNRYTELIKAYQAAEATAKEAQELCEKNLRKLKRESKEIVENMKVKRQLKEVYDDMDELKNVTAADKLLDSVRDKNKELDEVVEGSKVVHDNRISTRLQKADTEAKKIHSNEYLENLKKKYNK